MPAGSLQLKYATLCGISSVGVIQGGLFCDIIDSPHGTFYLDNNFFISCRETEIDSAKGIKVGHVFGVNSHK